MAQCGEGGARIQRLGPDPKTQLSHSHRNLLSLVSVSRQEEAEWPTRSESVQVDFISVPFKSNLIGVGRSGSHCEGGRKGGRI